MCPVTPVISLRMLIWILGLHTCPKMRFFDIAAQIIYVKWTVSASVNMILHEGKFNREPYAP